MFSSFQVLLEQHQQVYVISIQEKYIKKMVKLKGHVEPVYKRNKPYKCIVCDVCFAAKGNLEQHLALHSNSFIGMGKKVIAPLQGPAPLDRASGIRAAGGAMAPLDYDIIRTKTGVIKRPSINACPLGFSDFPPSLVEPPAIETPEPSDEDNEEIDVGIEDNQFSSLKNEEALEMNSDEEGSDVIVDGSDFRFKKSLEKHIASVHEAKKKNCSKCKASFLFKKSLEKHIFTAHEEKKNECSKCETSFRFKKSLEKHVASAHEEKKNKCSKCKASFRFKTSLDKHMASVHEEKKNKCSKCEASFRFKKSLKKHMVSLHEEKKNKCSNCDVSFKFERTLKKHIVSVHEAKKNKCFKCDVSFRFERTLKKHIVSVHEAKKNICSICAASFKFKRTLKKHIASVHGEEKPEKCLFKGKEVKKVRSSRNQNLSVDQQKYAELNSHRIDGESVQAFDSVHEEKKPDKCLSKKNIEVEEKEEKKVGNSRNQNLSDEKKYTELYSDEEESLDMNSDDSEDDRIDYEEDRTYDDPLVGKKLRCQYETGWHTGKIEYFNTKLEEYIVFFADESSDYIKKNDIDGLEIILLGENLPTSLIG